MRENHEQTLRDIVEYAFKMGYHEPGYDVVAAFRDSQPTAISSNERSLAIMEHDYPILRAFYDRYGIPPKHKPSCLVCGHTVQGQPGIFHAELPGIVVCKPCHERAIGETSGEHAAAWHRGMQAIATILEVNSADGLEPMANGIAAAIEKLRGERHDYREALERIGRCCGNPNFVANKALGYGSVSHPPESPVNGTREP